MFQSTSVILLIFQVYKHTTKETWIMEEIFLINIVFVSRLEWVQTV